MRSRVRTITHASLPYLSSCQCQQPLDQHYPARGNTNESNAQRHVWIWSATFDPMAHLQFVDILP
eukprot:12898243-Prorocentrum_lima.AAC.1